MTENLNNAFILSLITKIKDDEERVMMKITGVLVEILVEI